MFHRPSLKSSTTLAFLAALALQSATPLLAKSSGHDPATTTASSAPDYLTIDELRARYGDSESRYLTIGGMEVHYKDEGPRDAPVVMMVHGSQSSVRQWDRITEILSPRYRIIRFDIPGYGLSGRVSDEAAATVSPLDIPEALLAHLGVERLTFVGVSSGGTMGMFLAAKRPELVERLILSNTPSDPVKTNHLVMPQGFIDAQERRNASGFGDQDFWDEYLSYFSGDPERISAKTRREYFDFNRRTPEQHPIAMVARIGDGVQARIDMAKVTAPTFLIWGGADPLLPKSAANSIEAYLPSALVSRIIMPDVGHYPPTEVPDRFAQWIAAFIEAGQE
jgi:pimeloyl-ACP methyl ester carboxylesterase